MQVRPGGRKVSQDGYERYIRKICSAMQALARAGRARPPMAVRRSRPRSTTPVQPERP